MRARGTPLQQVERVPKVLSRHIRAGEKILWSGKPVMLPFIFNGLVSIPVGLFFLAIAVYYMSTLRAIATYSMLIPILIFLVIGLGVFLGPLIWHLMRYHHTEYMITDQRIITQTGAIGLDTRFVDLDKVQEVYVKVGFIDKIFGTGSIIATTAGFVPVSAPTFGIGTPGAMRPSIDAVKEPYEIQRLLQEAIERVRAGRLKQRG